MPTIHFTLDQLCILSSLLGGTTGATEKHLGVKPGEDQAAYALVNDALKVAGKDPQGLPRLIVQAGPSPAQVPGVTGPKAS